MGDYKLKTHVHAVEVDADGVRTGREGVFGPDSDMSASENEWALAAITNPDVWEGAQPPRRERPAATGGSDEVARLKARVAQLEAEKATVKPSDAMAAPEPADAEAGQPEPKPATPATARRK